MTEAFDPEKGVLVQVVRNYPPYTHGHEKHMRCDRLSELLEALSPGDYTMTLTKRKEADTDD